MKKIILSFLVLSISFVYSIEIDRGVARSVAASNFILNLPSNHQYDFKVKRLDIISDSEESPLIYVFNLFPSGFVLVSADKRATPVLGYSYSSSFKINDMPRSLKSIFDGYQKDIKNLRSMNTNQIDYIGEQWDNLLSISPSNNNTRNVSPLIDAEFDQGGNWNNYIQSEIGFNGPVGCVAVAMSQVMHYWGFPYTGEGSNSYVENDYGQIEVDFSSAYYDFDSMPDTYPSAAAQILLYHTGVSVNMDYDWSGSGAWVMGSYPSSEHAMVNYFKYDESMYHMYKVDNNVNQFREAIVSQLDDNKPVIMVGYGDDYGGGHAWNIDGYQGTNFHCNWGWGGSSNGYYNLTSMGGFPDGQSVLLNIIPRDIENPMALYEYDVESSTVTFFDLSSMVNDQQIRNWHWDFGDGSTAVTTTGNTDHTYALSGVYDVELIVENLYGMMSDPYIESISVIAASPGDLTGDSNLDVLDVVLMVSYILGDTPSESQLFIGDLNYDSILNIQDLVLLLSMILEG